MSRAPRASSMAPRSIRPSRSGNICVCTWGGHGVAGAGLGLAQSNIDRDTGGAQAVGPASGLRIGVAHRGDNTAYTRREERFGARRRPPVVVAGLERDVRRGAAWIIASLACVGK